MRQLLNKPIFEMQNIGKREKGEWEPYTPSQKNFFYPKPFLSFVPEILADFTIFSLFSLLFAIINFLLSSDC